MRTEARPEEALACDPAAKRALIFLNPVAGQTDPEAVREAIDGAFKEHGWEYQIHELVKEDLAGQVEKQLRLACAAGFPVVVAAGGDGTVAQVADGLIRQPDLAARIRLGIFPLGTANLLAREMGIPVGLPDAAEFLVTSEQTCHLDAMKIGDRHFLQRVGIGIDALTIRDTSRAAKRGWGRLAYVVNFVKALFGFGGFRFRFEVDGKQFTRRAKQAVVANSALIGTAAFRLGPNIDPTDSRLDLCVFNARRVLDYPVLFWRVLTRNYEKRSPRMQYFPVRRSVTIRSRKPVPAQADGEYIGETPVTVELVKNAVRVIGSFKCD